MRSFDVKQAQTEVRGIMQDANPGLAVAKYIGEPFDPEKRIPDIGAKVLEFDTAGVGEDVYLWEDVPETKEVISLASNGQITSVAVTPETPVQLTFADIVTKEYYITVSNILKGKYDVLAKKKITIERALNRLEVYKIIALLKAGVKDVNKFYLATGDSRFKFSHLIDMTEAITNYGDKYILICGATVNKDIVLWNYNEDKNQSIPKPADIGVEVVVLRGKVTVDAEEKDLVGANEALLVATAGSNGKKPGVFVRRSLKALDGAIQNRVVLPSSPIMAIGGNRVLSFGEIGYEQIALALANENVLALFSRELE